MTRLYTNNNYTYFEDTVTGDDVRYPTKDILYRPSANAIDILFKYDRATMLIIQKSDIVNGNDIPFANDAALYDWLDEFTGGIATQTVEFSGASTVSIEKNDLGYDAWGRVKTVADKSLFHGMFTYNVPVLTWYETFNGTQQTFTNATSSNGELHLVPGASNNDTTYLRTFRNPRYEPNRGMLYSTACILPNPQANEVRRWGTFTSEAGVFFELDNGALYGVVRTTYNGTTTDDRHSIPVDGFDASKGHVYDIQYQWRGVGTYKFFIDLSLAVDTGYLGTLTKLSMFNPALPLAFEAINQGDNEPIIVGCVDVTAEGGGDNGKTYGSVGMSNDDGQVSVSGYNTPIIAIRSKPTVGGLINTRDTLALLASAYGDQRNLFRVWSTRDFTAITENDQSWTDFGDGHLEYIEYDNPDVGTPMTFDTTKATLVFGCRVDQDATYATSALFEGRTEIYLTPGDMFVFTIHRESGGVTNVGCTFEFAEEI